MQMLASGFAQNQHQEQLYCPAASSAQLLTPITIPSALYETGLTRPQCWFFRFCADLKLDCLICAKTGKGATVPPCRQQCTSALASPVLRKRQCLCAKAGEETAVPPCRHRWTSAPVSLVLRRPQAGPLGLRKIRQRGRPCRPAAEKCAHPQPPASNKAGSVGPSPMCYWV